MRKATLCFLLVLLGSWTGYGQATTKEKFTSPRIVATFERLNQTAPISPTTIYTPKRWGTFRVSIVMVGTMENGQHNNDWIGGIQFTDGAGTNGFLTGFLVELPTDERGTVDAEFPIRAKAGLPIKFGVGAFGNTEGSKYNVWVVVEQLM